MVLLFEVLGSASYSESFLITSLHFFIGVSSLLEKLPRKLVILFAEARTYKQSKITALFVDLIPSVLDIRIFNGYVRIDGCFFQAFIIAQRH
jgi:hypothetical protein